MFCHPLPIIMKFREPPTSDVDDVLEARRSRQVTLWESASGKNLGKLCCRLTRLSNKRQITTAILPLFYLRVMPWQPK